MRSTPLTKRAIPVLSGGVRVSLSTNDLTFAAAPHAAPDASQAAVRFFDKFFRFLMKSLSSSGVGVGVSAPPVIPRSCEGLDGVPPAAAGISAARSTAFTVHSAAACARAPSASVRGVSSSIASGSPVAQSTPRESAATAGRSDRSGSVITAAAAAAARSPRRARRPWRPPGRGPFAFLGGSSSISNPPHISFRSGRPSAVRRRLIFSPGAARKATKDR